MRSFWQRHRSIMLLVLVLLGNMIWYGNTAFTIAKPTLLNLGVVSTSITGSEKEKHDSIEYSRLGIDVPVSILPNTSPLEQHDWDKLRTALTKGAAVSFTDNDFASSRLVFVTAHSSDWYPHAYAAAFASLHQAKIDDSFTLILNKQSYTYTIKDTEILSPTDIAAFEGLAPKDTKIQRAVLVTCWPLYSTQNRLVVIGERAI